MNDGVEPAKPASLDGRLAWLLAGMGPACLLLLLALPSSRAALVGPRIVLPASPAPAGSDRLGPEPRPSSTPRPGLVRPADRPAGEPTTEVAAPAADRVLEAEAAGRFLEQAYQPLLPASASALKVRIDGGRLRVAATIDPDRLQPELRAPLPDILQKALVTGLVVELGGQLGDGAPGRVRLTVEEARIGALPIPLDLVRSVVAAESGARGIDAGDGTVLSLPLPPGVGRLSLDGDRLLVRAGDGNGSR